MYAIWNNFVFSNLALFQDGLKNMAEQSGHVHWV